MQTQESRTPSRGPVGLRWNGLIALGLVAAVIAIYGQTRDFDVVRFDDPKYVSGSAYLRTGLSLDGIVWAFSGPFASNYFPLTLMSHMLDRDLYGDDYGGHHLTSVAIHALNALLLFAVLLYMTGARLPSALVAAVFAVHPLNVESVAWIAERKNLLSATFWMLSTGCYVAYARRGGVLRYGGAALALAAGLLAKPTLVTLPLVFLLLDYWPLGRVRWGRTTDPASADRAAATRPIGFLLVEKLPLLALSAASSWMTLYAQRGTIQSSETVTLTERIANATVAYASYLAKFFWPSGLAMHYPHPYKPSAGGIALEPWQIGGAAALGIGLSLLASRRRYASVGWLWFVGTLVPTIGLVQVGNQALADRYTYLPAIGLSIAIAWAGSEWKALARRPSASVCVAVALIALGSAAHRQAAYWRDSVSLFERVLELIPRNPKIRYNLANEYRARGQHAQAIEHYRIALESDPGTRKIRINLANSLASSGDNAAAIELYESVLQRSPNHPIALHNLAIALRNEGRLEDAAAALRRATEVAPTRSSSHDQLGDTLRQLGENDAASEQYVMAIQTGSDRASTWNKLAETLTATGRSDDAIRTYRRLLETWPDDVNARDRLAELLASRGESDAPIGSGE